MTIRKTDRFCRNADLVTREIAGETLLVPVSGKLANLADMFALNPSGAHVWQLLDGQHSARDAANSLVEHFEVSEEQAWQDVSGLLETLLVEELIIPSSSEASRGTSTVVGEKL
jgi:hypothetical protein